MLQYTQLEGSQLCAFKSLASVLHHLGWVKEALRLDLHGEKEAMYRLDAWKYLFECCQGLLPSWVQVCHLPNKFDWKHCLKVDMILVGVLHASDGHTSHAITCHGGYIFDSNEKLALPLCQAALDFCTCSQEKNSVFLGFKKGILFQYKGNKPEKKRKMRTGKY